MLSNTGVSSKGRVRAKCLSLRTVLLDIARVCSKLEHLASIWMKTVYANHTAEFLCTLNILQSYGRHFVDFFSRFGCFTVAGLTLNHNKGLKIYLKGISAKL